MKKLLLPCILFVSAFTGCAEFEELTPTGVPSTTAQTRAVAPGFEIMENPYDLARMRRLSGNSSLQRTHIYVRFLPADSTQLNLLEDELDLDLFDYPLDVNIEDDEEYVDPTIPEGEFTWQYTVVPANFVFPAGITWERISDTYIPAEDEEVPQSSPTPVIERNLERVAILDCGYELPLQTRANGDKRPDGTVTVFDNTSQDYVPVKGVRVKCHYFMKSGRAYTNEAGRYSINTKFSVRPKYTVVFKNSKDFIIWDGLGHRAKYKAGRHDNDGYDIVINHNPNVVWPTGITISVAFPQGGEWLLATVNNAAYDYYRMCETTGITKPPKTLRILVHPFMGNSAPMIRRFPATVIFTHSNWLTFVNWAGGLVQTFDALFKFVEPDLTINAVNNSYRDIYNSVNHELSHASHFMKSGIVYWGNYIDHILEKGGYGSSRSGAHAGYCEVGEMWGFAMGHIQEHEEFSFSTNVSYPYRIQEGKEGDWIRPDPIWALITRGVLTKKQVFDAMTSDVNTVDKWRNKLVSMYSSKANAITAAFAHNDVPAISGPDSPAPNTSVTYSIPTVANMSTDFTFTGWTVAPLNSGHTITGGTNSRTLAIKFTTARTYTLTANFTLPGGGTHSATKTVTVTTPPTVPTVPTISADKTALRYYNESVTFTVSSQQPGVTYEWQKDSMTLPNETGPTLVITANPPPGWNGNSPPVVIISPRFTVRCRAINGSGLASDWSNQVRIGFGPELDLGL